MARRNSLLAGGSGSASAILKNAQQKPTGEPAVDVSEEALRKRAERRKELPEHPLEFIRTGLLCRKVVERKFDFSQLAIDFPHHRSLINQLLIGMSLSLPGDASYKTIYDTYAPLRTFINFLNNTDHTSSCVTNVSHIDGFVLQAFKSYLILNLPHRKKSNTSEYRKLTLALKSVKQRFPGNALIGDNVPMPRAPRADYEKTEGYNSIQLKALIKCCLKDIMAIKKFHASYNALNGSSPQLAMVENGHYAKWRDDPDRRLMEVLSTIKNQWPEYPYYMSLDDAKHWLGEGRITGRDKGIRTRVRGIFQRGIKISFMDGNLGRGAIFAAQHFVADTIYPFLLLSMLLTGFNGECLKYMSDDIDGFTEDDLLDSDNYIVIYGYKHKTKKLIPFRSKKNQAHGPYRLLKYIADVVSKFKESEHYVRDVLFQFTRQKLATREGEDAGLICTFYGRAVRFHLMGASFVKRHGLQKLIGNSIDERKLRSGYATVALEGGVSIHKIGEHLGHSDAQVLPETADSYYISDTASVAAKNKVVTKIQNQLVSDICNYKHRTVTSKTLQQLRDAINSAKSKADRDKKITEAARELNLEEQVIVHLLDAGAQTYILACEDMSRPTWPGHEDYVKNGQCRQYNKCCMCRQAVVFPEALPYIAKRIMDVEEFQYVMTAIEWVANFGDERDAWRGILDAWNNNEQVERAWESAKSGNILLPKVMRGGTR